MFLVMYCECFLGQLWGVMICGDYIKFIYSCDKIYEIYRYVYDNYYLNFGDINVYKYCVFLFLFMLIFIFYLFVIIEEYVMSFVYLYLFILICECLK